MVVANVMSADFHFEDVGTPNMAVMAELSAAIATELKAAMDQKMRELIAAAAMDKPHG